LDGWLSVFSWIGLYRSSVWIFLLLLSKPVHLGQTNWCNNKQATIKGRGGWEVHAMPMKNEYGAFWRWGLGGTFFLGT